MGIGLTELIFIVVVVLAIFKADKLEEYSKTAAKVIKSVSAAMQEVNNEVRKPIEDAVNPIKEEIDETTKTVKDAVNGGDLKK